MTSAVQPQCFLRSDMLTISLWNMRCFELWTKNVHLRHLWPLMCSVRRLCGSEGGAAGFHTGLCALTTWTESVLCDEVTFVLLSNPALVGLYVSLLEIMYFPEMETISHLHVDTAHAENGVCLCWFRAVCRSVCMCDLLPQCCLWHRYSVVTGELTEGDRVSEVYGSSPSRLHLLQCELFGLLSGCENTNTCGSGVELQWRIISIFDYCACESNFIICLYCVFPAWKFL